MVIDGHDNKEREIEIGILQGLPVSPIFFLIYISGVFNVVAENNPTIISLSFVDNLRFIVSSTFVKEISQTLDIMASTILHLGSINVITYDTSKTEIVLFFKSHCQQLSR